MRTQTFPLRTIPATAGLPLLVAAAILSSLWGCSGSKSSSGSTSPTPTPTATPTPIVSLTGVLAAASTRDTGGVESQIYAMNADGTSLRRLSNIGATESPGGWSPGSGATLVFSSNRDNGGGLSRNSDVYVMNSDGSGVRRVTKDTEKNSITPSWSPDGSKIAFSYGKSIAVVPAGSSALTPTAANILTDATVSNAYGPVWSPDGAKIAFIANLPGSSIPSGSYSHVIFVMNADGSGRTRITEGSEYIHQVAWSPDGTAIVFDGSRDTGGATSLRTQLYRIAPNGSGRTRLTNNSGSDISPVWSPDGKVIMYSSNHDRGGGSGGANGYDLYVVNPTTLAVARVTTNGQNYFLGPQNWKAN